MFFSPDESQLWLETTLEKFTHLLASDDDESAIQHWSKHLALGRHQLNSLMALSTTTPSVGLSRFTRAAEAKGCSEEDKRAAWTEFTKGIWSQECRSYMNSVLDNRVAHQLHLLPESLPTFLEADSEDDPEIHPYLSSDQCDPDGYSRALQIASEKSGLNLSEDEHTAFRKRYEDAFERRYKTLEQIEFTKVLPSLSNQLGRGIDLARWLENLPTRDGEAKENN